MAAERPAAQSQRSLNEAPHFFLQEDGGIIAKWIEDGELLTQDFQPAEPIDLPEFYHVLGEELDILEPRIHPAVWDMPEKMLVLSDVEGEFDSLLRFLQANGVVDEKGHWSYGKGHLVGIGDMVDRGTQVTETLLLFYRLSLEAEAAGGHLHFILGNHEVMLMGGDIRYARSKYKQAAALMGIPCRGLLGADTVVGRWLRTCNSIERVGDLLFVHAGISTAAAQNELNIDRINTDIRSVMGILRRDIEDSRKEDLAWGRYGPLWYRGYFAKYTATYGPVQPVEDLDRILKQAGAKRVIVGHTHVDAPTGMFEDRVLAIDVTWTKPDDVRALLFEDGEMVLVDIKGERSSMELKER
jgi:hypothetical protein